MNISSYYVDSDGNVIIKTNGECSVYLDSSDIMKWLDAQEDPNILDRIARYAQKRWRQASHNNIEDNDFRSRT